MTKSLEIINFLDFLADRSESLKQNKCLNPPMGCGKPITGFRDTISAKEYSISGFCQECQDKLFKEPEE